MLLHICFVLLAAFYTFFSTRDGTHKNQAIHAHIHTLFQLFESVKTGAGRELAQYGSQLHC